MIDRASKSPGRGGHSPTLLSAKTAKFPFPVGAGLKPAGNRRCPRRGRFETGREPTMSAWNPGRPTFTRRV